MNLARLHPENLVSSVRARAFRALRSTPVAALLSRDASAFASFAKAFPFHSNSQILQDLFVLWWLGTRERGFFVEFGAADGVVLSNSLLLERSFGWSGIVAEPARVWHAALSRNRRCKIDHRCVWSKSGEVIEFAESGDPEYSTATTFIASTAHGGRLDRSGRYDVSTVSLGDLLIEHGAPRDIDYLSIDTEGSEADILESFDFARWRVAVITVEHNFHPSHRRRIRSVLARHGYRRCLPEFSEFDDWFVLCDRVKK